MPSIATIGFGKKGAEQFVELLREASVTTVIDTRRRPDSPLSGYARKRDLPYILKGAGIGYEYRPELAPPDALLSRYRSDKDWAAYERDFDELVLQTPTAAQAMSDLVARSKHETVALLCSEPTPDRCHRRLVTERMSKMDPSLKVIHLA